MIIKKYGETMGLFDKLKQNKEVQWFINKKIGSYQIEDKYIRLTTKVPKKECTVFYKDILNIRKGNNTTVLETINKEYHITAVNGENPKEAAEKLYITLLEKISEYK